MTKQEFDELVRLHGEENGGTEDFYQIDEDRIGCRYADCCIRRLEDGWHYARNHLAYPTPAKAYENRRESA